MLASEYPSEAERITYLEKRVRVLTRLAEISASLNSQIGLKPLLHRIMEAAVDMLECEAASVLLWNSDTHQLFFAASTNDYGSQHLIGSPVPMNSLAGEILQANDIVQVDDVKSHPKHYDKVDKEIGFQTRSVLGIPMTYRNRVIGVLEALNKRQLPWTDDDRQYLKILSAQAAVALEGAQLVMELRRANRELSQLDEIKDHFIAIASHELRTPLGVIMGYAAFLQEDESETARENATHVLNSALKLRSIIEEMVNLNYLKQKEGDLKKDYVRVADLFATFERETIALMDILNREVTIRPPEEDVMVYVDAVRMHMALTNIFNNAVAFTEEDGKIVVHAATDRENIHISVKDDGIGIEPDKLELIFKEFYQLENHLVRKHEGMGIGLSITRAIVQAHRGRIGAASRGPGKGTTVTITLPIARPGDANQD